MREHFAVIHRGSVYELWTADKLGENQRRIGTMPSRADALRWYDERKRLAGWTEGELPREVR